MKDGITGNFLFIIAGVVALYIGLKWKKPSYSYDIGVVHKYGLIILGSMCVIYGIASFF